MAHRRHTHWWDRFVDWVAESRSHRVICLVACIWLLNAFDLDLTLTSYEAGMLNEQNPFAREMLRFGPMCVALFKVGLVLVGSYPLLKFRHLRIAELGSMVVLAAYILLAIRWTTCYDYYAIALTGHTTSEELRALIGELR